MSVKEKLKKILYRSPIHKIPSVQRILHDRLLIKILKKEIKLEDTVIDIGSKDAPYKDIIKCKKYFTFDIDKSSKPDILGNIENYKSKGVCDLIIATNLLEHLYNPKKAIGNMKEMLTKKGTCIVSVPFICAYHPDPNDYFRYTQDSLKEMFKDFEKVEIIPYGNRITAIWHILSYGKQLHLLYWFNPLIALFDKSSRLFPAGYILIAKK